MGSNIIALPGRRPHPELARLERAATYYALQDVAALCEVAAQSQTQGNPAVLTEFSRLMVRLYDINLSALPRKALKVEELALCAGGGLFRYFESHFMAPAQNATACDRLDPAAPATRVAVIDRALRDQRHIIPAVTTWLMRGHNATRAPYYAAGQNAAELLIRKDIGIKNEFEGVAIYRRVNEALRGHGLELLPSPFVPPPGPGPRLRPV